MKKTTLAICALLGLSACATYETDLDKAQMQREYNRAIERQENGCQFTDDHLAYRDCLINTYKNQKPKTYSTTIDENGKSVAIVKNETTQSYDEDTGTYKTERVIVIETEEKLVPVQVATEETVVSEVPTEQVVETTTETKEVVSEAPVPATVPADEVVPVATPAAEPVQKETWWDEHQKNKAPVAAEPQCPCADPNDPCPQCIGK